MKSKRNKLICIALSFCLFFSMFSGGSFALSSDEHWSKPAVDTLNSIYGSNIFVTSDDALSVADANKILADIGTDVTTAEDDSFTRSDACTAVANVFDLPIGEEQSAIEYMYEKKIISGKADGTLDEGGVLSKAEFAVLTYRVLNFVGAGLFSGTQMLKPGTAEYFAWMYLSARRCVPFSVAESVLNGKIADTMVNTYIVGSANLIYQDKKGEQLWSAWLARLDELGVSHSEATYNAEDTVIEAAVKLTNATRATQIFTDVNLEDWFYDGVMYLFDNRIVSGNGDGTFAGNANTPLFQLAILMTQTDDIAGKEGAHFELDAQLNQTDPNAARLKLMVQKINYAVEKGYILGVTSLEDKGEGWNPADDTDWSRTTTREEAVYSVLKQQGRNVSGTNTDILERFSDSSQVSETAKPYMAYAVSAGLINGERTGDEELGRLNPKGDVIRAALGVLLYRNLIGVDTTKMQDYAESVSYALSGETQTSMRTLRTSNTKTLVLGEDWRLTSNLYLNVPEGTNLTITGDYYIYEMGGKLINNGKGNVNFINTILYPSADDADAENVYAETSWDADESARLLLERNNIHSENGLEYTYSVINDDAKYKYEISMTSTENIKGTFIVALYDNNRLVGVASSAMQEESLSYKIPLTIIPTTQDAAKYKIMFWNTSDTLKPLCKVVKGNVEAK